MLGHELSSAFSNATGSTPGSGREGADCAGYPRAAWPRAHWFLSLTILVASALLVGCGRSVNAVTNSTLTRKQLEENASKGDAQAQNLLGKMCLEGSRSDQTQAVHYFEAAAGQGVIEAQYYLGMMAEAGRGLPRNDTNALQWYRKAAEGGHRDAQYSLAVMYAAGRGTERQKEESVKWFRAAADQGLPEAQFNLGQRYQFGQGVPTNLVEAYKWFAIASKNGIADAKQTMTQLKPLLSSEQLRQAEAGASAFSPQSR